MMQFETEILHFWSYILDRYNSTIDSEMFLNNFGAIGRDFEEVLL